MQLTRPVRTFAHSTILCLLLHQVSAAQFEDLANVIPDEANAIVLISPERIFASPIAVREKWREEHAEAFAAGVAFLPPSADLYVMATQLDLDAKTPLWELAVLRLSEAPSLDGIARRHNGHLETISGKRAVGLPSNSLLVDLGENIVGIMTPANRQTVARWIREGSTGAGPSPYLREAVAYAAKDITGIIMALDLEDAVPPRLLQQRIATLKTLESRSADVEAIGQVLSSIRGVTLGVTVRDRLYGAIKVDFRENVEILGDSAMPMLLEIIGNNGMMIDDFESWKAQLRTKQIMVQGPLSESGLRHVLSLVQPPTIRKLTAGEHQAESPDEQSKAYSSQKYFTSVNTLFDDMRKRKGAKSIGIYGTWASQYAKRIDGLPILNVDSDLVDFGGYVAQQLRNAAAAIQGIGIRTAAGEASIYHQAYGGYNWGRVGLWGRGGSGYYYQNNVYGQRRAIRAQERAQGATNAKAILQEVDNEMAKMRRQMTEKYQVEF
jgi:hypothetical protein